MARGYLFEVSKNKDKVYCVDSNYFADKLGTLGVESIKDDKSGDHTKDLILSDLAKTGVTVVDNFGIRVTRDNKYHIFLNRYNRFKSLARNLSLDDFCNDVYEVEQVLNNRNGDLVYDADNECIYTWDSWLRQVEEDCVYYFGNVMIIK